MTPKGVLGDLLGGPKNIKKVVFGKNPKITKNYKNQISVIAGNYSFKNIKEELLCVKKKNENKPMLIGNEEVNYFEIQLIKLLNEIFDKNKPFEQIDNSCSCDYCKALGIF